MKASKTVSVSKIIVFPDAGTHNPCQYLMVQYLRKKGYSVEISGNPPVDPYIINRIRKTNADIIYFDWVQDYLLGENFLSSFKKSIRFLLAIIYAKYILRKKIVHTIHNIHNHAKRLLKTERFFYRIFLKLCDSVRVYSESTIVKANAYFNIRLSDYIVAPDVPYGFFYDTNISRKDARAYFDIPEKDFVYLFIGNVKPYKGVEDLIRVFSLDSFKDDHLFIAGLPASETYKQLIREEVSGKKNIRLFEKFIHQEELKYYMECADVVVLPFRNIEHSGSLELAMTFSKPVITIKAPSILNFLYQQPELLYNQLEELEERMLLAKKTDLNTIGKNNYKIAHQVDYSRLEELFV